METPDGMIYTFDNENGTYDFVKISHDLHKLLVKKNSEEIFVDSYAENKFMGAVEILHQIGLSRISVLSNLQIFSNLNKETSIKFLKQIDPNIDIEDRFHEHDTEVLYN